MTQEAGSRQEVGLDYQSLFPVIHLLYLVPYLSQKFLEPMVGIYITTYIFIDLLCLDDWGHRATWVHRNRHLDTNTYTNRHTHMHRLTHKHRHT